MTDKELSTIRSAFDLATLNHSEIINNEDNCLIIGPEYSDLKFAMIAKNGVKYDIEWTWADKCFSKTGITLAQIKKILKGYS